MSTTWKVISIVTLVAVILTAAAVVFSNPPLVKAKSAEATQATNRSGLSTAALAAEGVGATGITVTGQGQVKGKPDVAYLTLGVRTFAPTAREAMSQNSAAMAAVIAKLEAVGIAKKDLQTGSINLYPQTKPVKSDQPESEQIVGYWANNSLNVTINDVTKVGEVLDAAIAAGANTAGGIRFGVKDEAKLRDEALKEAVKAARAKADLMATGLGIKVTGVVSVTEEGYSGPVPVARYEVAAAKDTSGVPVEAGELTFSATVRVTFSF